MANLNINSLLKHIDELQVIMTDTSMHILAINETKIDNLVSDNEIKNQWIQYNSEGSKWKRWRCFDVYTRIYNIFGMERSVSRLTGNDLYRNYEAS